MDATIFRPISTQKTTAGATASDSEAAPGGAQCAYLYGDALFHVDANDGTATTSAMPIATAHYISVSVGQTLSIIRGDSTDVNVWITWGKE